MTKSKGDAKKKARILAIDDSPTQLEALEYLLESSGFDVVTARDGREGLSAVQDNDIALVISDVVMPEIDGYAFCKALRSDESIERIPVILLTSLSDPQDVIRGLESGADTFICKPYEDRDLVARVQNVLANQELRKTTHSELGIDIYFHGQHFLITADRLQILDLLLSTYENAVSRNTDLIRAHEELKIANEGLESKVAERTAELVDRVKEVECLYAISKLVADPGETIEETLESALSIIPRGFRYPEIARARIHFEGKELAPKDYGDGRWSMSAPIMLSGNTAGDVEVRYLKEMPPLDDGPFLLEERNLVIDIARQLGVMVKNMLAEAQILSVSRFPEENVSPVLRIREDGVLLYANPSAAPLLEHWGTGVGEPVPEEWAGLVHEARESETRQETEMSVEGRFYAFSISPIKGSGYANAYGRDITERKSVQTKDRLSYAVLDMLNRSANSLESLKGILLLIREYMGFEALAIRLREGDDFPYYASVGFSEDFSLKERFLCELDGEGAAMLGADGLPILECMCGNVLMGRTPSTQACFTTGGSFWTNSTTGLLRETSEADLQGRTRNRCNREGFESMALIPLKDGNEIIGLLQFNDHRKDLLTLDTVQFFEGLGAAIGLALSRQRAGQDLQEERNFANKIIDTAQVIVLVLDGECRILRINSFMETLTGYASDEVRGRDWVSAFIPPAKAEETRAVFRAALAGRQTHGRLDSILAKDGREIYVSWYSNVMKDGDGRTIGLLAIGNDISDFLRATEAQRTSEIRYRRLFEAAKDGILILNAGTGVIMDVNPFLSDLIGYPREDIIGIKIWELGFFGDVLENQENFSELIEKGYLRYENLPLRTASGGKVEVEFVSNVYKMEGETVVQCNIRDISERVRAEAAYEKLEEQLRVSQKLEAIGSLAGGIAHDFNNLLCVILNYAGFASGKIRPEDHAIKDDIDEVMKAAERAAALTRQLLAFSRKQVLQPVPLDLNEIASGLEKMLRRILGEDIDYIQTLAPDLGLILADPGQIEQVAMNLVVNARDAMPQGGKLTIETSNAEVDEEYAMLHPGVVPGPYVRFTITDSGFGMDKETMARIFEPFFTTKEQGKGTGLGLSTVYGIVKQSSGNISVYSEPGVGTSFKIFFPRLPSDIGKRPLSRKESLTLAMGKETILIADDEESMRRLAQRILREAGYEVLTAGNGDEAIKVSTEYPGKIHLLLTDVVMPNMSGRSLSQKIGERRADMKIVFMSGYTNDAIIHHGVLEAGTLFLGKPFNAADLRQKIRAALDGRGSEGADWHIKKTMDDPVKEERLSGMDGFGPLQESFLIKMREAVKAAQYDEIISLTETIQAASPDAAARFRRMAEQFDYIGLRDVLSRIEEKRGAE